MFGKILVGCSEIALNTINIAKGLRELGYEVYTATKSTHNLYGKLKYDFILPKEELNKIEYKCSHYECRIKKIPDSLKYLFEYDTYIFIAGETLVDRMADLPLLREMGKTVIMMHVGSELRYSMPLQNIYNDLGYDFPQSDKAPHSKPIETPKQILDARDRYFDTLINKQYTTRMSEKYADLVLAHPSFNGFAVRPFSAVIIPVDYARCVSIIPKRDIPILLHGVTNPLLKRSDLILDAIGRLQREGLPFEFKLLSNVPNKTMLRKLTEADVVLDRIACGGVGLFGYEAMGSGCAVLGSNEEDLNPLPQNRPVLSINKDNVYERIKRIIKDKKLRIDLAERGRAYVESGFNTPKAAAAHMLNALERARRDEYDYYPFFYFEEGKSTPTNPVPVFLRQLTLEIAQMYGISPNTDLAKVIKSGLLPEEVGTIPRWELSKIPHKASTVYCGLSAGLAM